MGRASSNKKVNRAASTGGGRTARGRTPVLWYSTLFLVVAVGVFLVFSSSKDLRNVAADTTAPQVGKDHWHAAYGIYICDAFVAPLTDKHGDRYGIHSHGDGLMHTHPAVASAAGKNATIGKFFLEEGVKTSATSIELPKSTGAKRLKVKNGDKCAKKKGKVEAWVFKNQADTKGQPFKGDPSDWKIENGKIIVVAFVADGTTIPKPPSAANLADPGDVGSPNQSPPTSTSPSPSDSTPPTVVTPTPAVPPTTAKK